MIIWSQLCSSSYYNIDILWINGPLSNNCDAYIFRIIRSADKVFKDAAMFDRTEDEERSFVMYMKYFNILKQVKSKPDYKKQKVWHMQILIRNSVYIHGCRILSWTVQLLLNISLMSHT